MYVFDIYGGFKNKLSYLGLTDVTVIGKTLVGVQDGNLLLYTFGTLQERRWLLPTTKYRINKYVLRKGHFYLLDENELVHYTY